MDYKINKIINIDGIDFHFENITVNLTYGNRLKAKSNNDNYFKIQEMFEKMKKIKNVKISSLNLYGVLLIDFTFNFNYVDIIFSVDEIFGLDTFIIKQNRIEKLEKINKIRCQKYS